MKAASKVLLLVGFGVVTFGLVSQAGFKKEKREETSSIPAPAPAAPATPAAPEPPVAHPVDVLLLSGEFRTLVKLAVINARERNAIYERIIRAKELTDKGDATQEQLNAVYIAPSEMDALKAKTGLVAACKTEMEKRFKEHSGKYGCKCEKGTIPFPDLASLRTLSKLDARMKEIDAKLER